MQLKHLTMAALAGTVSAQQMNLTAALQGSPDLSNLTTYVGLFPDLLDTLASATNITILAPSNDAFAKLLEGPMGAAIMANDTDLIQAVLTYHVLNGTYPASVVTDTGAFIPTLLTDSAYSNVTGGQVVEAIKSGDDVLFFSGLRANSTVTQADTNFTGGIIHVIDTVLTPPQNISTTAGAAGLTAIAGALTAADLVATLDSLMDVTVFVPNNDAFLAIGSALPNLTTEQLTSILEYHVINGTVAYSSTLSNTSVPTLAGPDVTISIVDGSVFVNSAKVILPDILVANGVVHVIDNVLNPNATSATPDATASTQTPAFAGASSVSSIALTSGIPTASSAFPTGQVTPASSAAAPPMSTAASTAAAAPMKTGAVGFAALFGAGAALMAA
ncbi:MAG: hypothetical protein M4579_004447 [Chaenotheca gracillima]|nr:MAG: hypothetical protein M4579_004447 [Chaenotheca gracillima]